jgi:hypothetical protein
MAPPTKNIQCDVESPDTFGQYANAFRIVEAGGRDLFLDFCVYSEEENRARVVARIRCRPSFLNVIRKRISEDLQPDPLALFVSPLIVPEG